MTQPKPVRYTIDADARGFRAATRRAADDLGALGRRARATDRALDMNANVDVDGSALGRLRAALLAQKAALENDINVDLDVDGAAAALAQLKAVENRIRSVDRMRAKAEVKVDVDRGLLGAGGLVSRMFAGAGTLGPKIGQVLSEPLAQGMSAAARAPGVGLALAAGVAAAAAVAGPFIVQGIAAAAGGAIAAGAGTLGYKLLGEFDTIDKARRKAGVVFGADIQRITTWAQGLSGAVGLGREQVVGIAAGVQDLLVPKGFTRGAATDITRLIVERGAAIAEFQGLDAQQGVEAVTGALLGQTRQLKSMGVEVGASLIKQRTELVKSRGYWTDYGEDGVKSADDVRRSVAGMNDEQLKTVATLELIQQRSGDAWTQFRAGATSADDILDVFNSTLANLKTDAIAGFGAILVEVIDDFRNAAAALDISLSFDDGGLAAWIEAHHDQIRQFFIDVARMSLQGVKGLAGFVKGMAGLVDPLLQFTQAALAGARGLSYVGQALALAKDPARFRQINDMFTGLRQGLDSSYAGVGSFRAAWATVGPAVIGAMDGIEAAADRGLIALDRVQAVSDIKVAVGAAVDEDSFGRAAELLEGLSRDEKQAVILATVGADIRAGDYDKVRSFLAELDAATLKDVTATLKAELARDGLTKAESDLLTWAAGQYEAALTVTPDFNSSRWLGTDPAALAKAAGLSGGLQVPVTADTTPAQNAIAGISAPAPITVAVDAPNLGAVKQGIAGIPASKQTSVTVTDAGSAAAVAGRLTLAARKRTAQIAAVDNNTAARVSGLLTIAARKRTAQIAAVAAGTTLVNSLLNWVARDRTSHITVVRHTVAAGGGDDTDDLSAAAAPPGLAVGYTLAAAGRATTTTPGQWNTPTGGDPQLTARTTPRRTELVPAARPAATEVNVYLDSRQIAAHITTGRGTRRA